VIQNKSEIPVISLVAVLVVGLLYVVYVHHWYWYEGAFIETACIDTAPPPGPNEFRLAPACWWQEDSISNFLHGLLANFASSWNPFMASQDSRVALAAVVVILYGAWALASIKLFLDWLVARGTRA
jgi:hypothetical protein